MMHTILDNMHGLIIEMSITNWLPFFCEGLRIFPFHETRRDDFIRCMNVTITSHKSQLGILIYPSTGYMSGITGLLSVGQENNTFTMA